MNGAQRGAHARDGSLREHLLYLLVADPDAYHLGQLVAARRLLGAWSSQAP